MKKVDDFYQEYLEWEVLNPEQEITNLTFEVGLYELREDCIIKFHRDNQFNLVASISGIANNPEELEPRIEKINGTFVKPELITGYSKNGLYKYRILGIVLGASECNRISENDRSLRFTANLKVTSIEKSFNQGEYELGSLQEWYLCGSSEIHFPRSTFRSVDNTYKRLRDGIDPEEGSRLFHNSNSARDYLVGRIANTSFIVSKVPKELGVEWSFNLAIEYRQEFGRIPNLNEREAISELVSLLFGNQLLKIGESFYNKDSALIGQFYQNPWGDNVVSKCQRIGLPPVDISIYQEYGKVEKLLNELLPEYLKLRDQLKLKDTLWKYWIAKYSSIGANLPILSSAVETLADRFLKNHPEVKPYYVEFKKFNEIIKEELTFISQKLGELEQKSIIINKIKGASQRGSNEKLEMMFEILKLPIDKIEREAIKSRNKMAHSSLGDITEEESKEIARLTKAYETLFHRVLLKVLSYRGQYIDYYTFGYPSRDIDEPIPVVVSDSASKQN